ncbi:uncharacterized protein L203_105915 [Cryptococcus depauperatus CBS 7841]|uniref:Uncharacterized protein n=1 Tax=Cryptococcus depauperatus CBS 7841 TaxID=1295531 RepID=A0A1E3HJ33_9TREE|nr:hypothetical protein L203_06428 [Cryptococcus depauperatus CBS 7841]
MYKIKTVSPILRFNPRFITTYPTRFNRGPSTTQGHTLDKLNDDPQASAATSGIAEKSSSSGSGESQPFDAARQGGEAGERKTSTSKGQTDVDKGQAGAFQDQVGGQPSSSQGVEYGGKEEASESKSPEGDALKRFSGFNSLKKLCNENKNFHTSARTLQPSSIPKAHPSGSSEPVDTQLAGDQNQHLKHSSPTSEDSGKGNAASTPHLPSRKGKQANEQLSSSHQSSLKQHKEYMRAPNDPSVVGPSVAATAFPQHLESMYGPDATPSAPENLKPSSKVPFSSTAVDPPHPILTKQAKEGGLADRNTQPTAEMGKQGIQEAWKHRR